MTQAQSNIFHMQCWVFRMAQKKWDKTPEESVALFRQYDLFGYISECYELLCMSSYECALDDLEPILKKAGVDVC